MTEDLSPILEDVDPKIWGEEILIMKSREMNELINKKRHEVNCIDVSYDQVNDDDELSKKDKEFHIAIMELFILKKKQENLNKYAYLVKL